MKKRHFSFGVKLGLLIGIISITTISLGIIYFYLSINSAIWNLMGKRMMDLGKTGQFLLSEDDRKAIVRLNELTEKYAINRNAEKLKNISEGNTEDGLPDEKIKTLQISSDFLQIVKKLRMIKNASRKKVYFPQFFPQKIKDISDAASIRYIYILTKIPESQDLSLVKFIADGDYESIDENNNGKIDPDEQPTSIGMIYNINGQPQAKDAFSGLVSHSKEYYTDKWGTWFSAYIPILDAKNQVIAIMGIDMDVNSEVNLIKKLKYIVWTIIIIGFLIIAVASTVAANFFTRPIRQLREGAEKVANRDFNARINVKSNDELGLLAKTFNSMVNEIKSYAENLEEMVTQRTNELSQTLAHVQALKNQQDADYFLTTLLTSPLFRNRNRSNKVETSFLLDQKKKFLFKSQNAEIGGDLAITGNLFFNHERWTMFFNGDAMGKSIQGAGGALVMGALVNSIMSRSAAGGKVLSITPQEWITDTFQELQRVFETFDGSMMVSCVLGLINDENGELLYFNAEHPYSVLFRNNKASFLENEISVNKIGMPIQKELKIRQFQLLPNDMIICGSDGRDDILFGNDEKDIKNINSDENLFLSIVEKANGDLEKIRSLLIEKGKIIDDLSLLRTVYHGDKIIQKSERFDNAFIKKIADYIKNDKYDIALPLLEKMDNKNGFYYLYYNGLILIKQKKFEEAIPILKLATDQIDQKATVLRLIAKAYLKLEDNENSLYFLKQSELFDPDHKQTKQMIEIITRKLDKEKLPFTP